MGVGFLDPMSNGAPYSGLLFPAVLVCLICLFRGTTRAQVISLKSSACALLVYFKWYFESFVEWRYAGTNWHPFCCGLSEGCLWDVVLLGAMLFLFVFQLVRLAPILAARLRE